MSLTMTIGSLAECTAEQEDLEMSLEELKDINEALKRHGMLEHLEPTKFPDETGYWNFGIGYGAVEAFILKVKDLLEKGRLKIRKECVAHLIEHSTCDGYWLPRDFHQLILEDKIHIGSAYRLKEICEAVAPLLNIPVPLAEIPFDYTGEGEEILEFMSEQTEDSFCRDDSVEEKLICIVLYQASRISIKNGMWLGFN